MQFFEGGSHAAGGFLQHVDVQRGLILVRGSVPGAKGGFVRITDAIKKTRPDEAPYPAGLKTDHPQVEAETPGEEAAPEAETFEEKAPAEVEAEAAEMADPHAAASREEEKE